MPKFPVNHDCFVETPQPVGNERQDRCNFKIIGPLKVQEIEVQGDSGCLKIFLCTPKIYTLCICSDTEV